MKSGTQHFVLRLYVASGSASSAEALANLKDLCERHLAGRHSLEIIDVLKEPLRSLSDGVLVTPTLLKIVPAPKARVIGDLSDTQIVFNALSLH